jgi:hypothetical protein
MKRLDFTYLISQRDHFRSGDLMLDWAEKYPMLFDKRDVEICQNQPDYHFFEWLGAVVFYEATGYLSLVEKYESKSHPRKVNTLKRAVPSNVFDYIQTNRSGVPDLFVYARDLSDWFFCEIKGNNDRIRKNQSVRFKELEALSGREVMVLKFKELKTNK